MSTRSPTLNSVASWGHVNGATPNDGDESPISQLNLTCIAVLVVFDMYLAMGGVWAGVFLLILFSTKQASVLLLWLQ
jgi:hypothetical protein